MSVQQSEARHVEFDAVFNFRDLGGYPTGDGRSVRWGRLYRADGIHRLVDTDLDRVRDLGLRTVVDLRTADEVDRGRFPVEHDRLSDHGIAHHHLPVLASIWDADVLVEQAEDYLSDRYVDMVAEGAPALAAVLQLMADADRFPLVFHCAAGKDRTGVTAAMVLSVLGVPDEVIAHDYGLSAGSMARERAWHEANSPEVVEEMARFPAAWGEAPPEVMHRLLAHVRAELGSFESYLAPYGVDRETVDAVRANLLVRGS